MAIALDTAIWNLGAVMVLGACGPQVPVDGDTEGGGTTTTMPGGSEGPTPECRVDADCPDGGYVCVANECIYECYEECCDDDCCLGECGPYYDCYGDEDCLDGEICTYGSCGPVPELEICASAPQVVAQLPIATELTNGVLSLAFVHMENEPGNALAIGAEGVTLLANANGELDLVGPSTARQIAVGDVDGDGDSDLVLMDENIVVYRQREPDEIAGEAFEALQSFESLDPAAIALTDYDGDGNLDLFVAEANGIAAHEGDGTAFGPGVSIDGPSTTLVAVRDGSTGFGAIAYEREQVYLTDAPGGAIAYRPLPEHGAAPLDRQLLASDLDGDLHDDVIGMALVDGRTQVHAWWGAPDSWYPMRWSMPSGLVVGAGGDFDGDGRGDLVFGGFGGLALVLGGDVGMAGDAVDGLARCVTWLETPLLITAIAAGDFDGDGAPEIAITDGTEIAVLTLGQ